MATDSLWIRLNIDWDRAKWIRHLPRSTRSLWPDLLRWVKMNSPVKGFVKYTGSVDDLADDLRLDPEDAPLLAQLLSAAVEGGAITMNGEVLQICQWDEYQDPETIRKRRAREEIEARNKKMNNAPQNPDNTPNPECADNSGHSAKTETETETETETVIEQQNAHGLAPVLMVIPMAIDVQQHMVNLGVDREKAAVEAERYFNRRQATGWRIGSTRIVDWRADVKGWVDNPNFSNPPPMPNEPPGQSASLPARYESPMQQMERLAAAGAFGNAG